MELERVQATTGEGVTVVWSRRAKPGSKATLENVIERLARAMSAAHGYEGVVTLRPQAGHLPIFTMVAHFASQADLDAWVSSEIRGRLYAEAEAASVGGLNVQQAVGLEGWFQMPGQPLVVPPPRYKTAIITWIAILPLLVIANLIGTALLPRVSPFVRLIPVSIVLIALMTWVVMPQMTRWFRFWLYPKAH
ncbi:MAG TPA: antibiotic biosynthesis monooxygenase [Candidatus Dormibacteraeota bacterium]|nr:antibiotic biosynthesis monooxygenase [Candidatus Dormibacteraeota bacterium]